LKLRASVRNEEDKLRAGMFAKVSVILPEQASQVIVPTTAVVHASYGDSVFVVEDKKPDAPGMRQTPDGKPVRVARQQFVRPPAADEFVGEMLVLMPDFDESETFEREKYFDDIAARLTPRLELVAPSTLESSGDDEPVDPREPGYVDWPKERRDAAARVLAREAETERIAKLFAGPQGTWASLTKRQQSDLNHFRWKPGVDGLERDEKGNTIYRVSDGCSLVNFVMIACALGKKPPAYGDMFKDMRLYFDEQRRPATKEGNGREPESMRPPKWSKPLP
jgi:hypothetical protein